MEVWTSSDELVASVRTWITKFNAFVVDDWSGSRKIYARILCECLMNSDEALVDSSWVIESSTLLSHSANTEGRVRGRVITIKSAGAIDMTRHASPRRSGCVGRRLMMNGAIWSRYGRMREYGAFWKYLARDRIYWNLNNDDIMWEKTLTFMHAAPLITGFCLPSCAIRRQSTWPNTSGLLVLLTTWVLAGKKILWDPPSHGSYGNE